MQAQKNKKKFRTFFPDIANRMWGNKAQTYGLVQYTKIFER